jgi:hypothetical protein
MGQGEQPAYARRLSSSQSTASATPAAAMLQACELEDDGLSLIAVCDELLGGESWESLSREPSGVLVELA